MIVTDTGCNNILVVGDYATSVSRRVAAATDALTIVGRSAQHGINPLLQGRIILPNLSPGGGGQRRRDQVIRTRTLIAWRKRIYLGLQSGHIDMPSRRNNLLASEGCARAGHDLPAVEGSMPARTPLATFFVRSM